MIDYIEPLIEGIIDLISNPSMIIMWLISGILYYFGIYKKKEPLLLIPISTGILLANLPMGELIRVGGNGEPDGFLRIFQNIGMNNDLLPLLIFLGMGALTDFEPVLSNPKTLLLGAAAQVGVFAALLGALVLSLTPVFDFGLLEASSIGIIGGADGPTTIFISTRMREIGNSLPLYQMSDIVGATAVAAYSYMALVPIIQPPIIRLFTTKNERKIRMEYSEKKISKRTKILFPILTIIIVSILVPDASPLISIMMFGNILRESGVVDRLAKTAQNELMNVVIILLGLSVGATMPASVFLKLETISIFILGLISFVFATISGILLAKLMNLFLSKPINPMIGAAGVSAVPMAARVVQNEAFKEDPENYLLMHAMGPNIAGVIGTATVAGVLLALVPQLVA
jgi:oxaloacetate decarboxylase beta subunit